MNKLKSLEGLFGGRHFDREIIILCVRWYLRYKLSSYRSALLRHCPFSCIRLPQKHVQTGSRAAGLLA
jgi:hypothetical protein